MKKIFIIGLILISINCLSQESLKPLKGVFCKVMKDSLPYSDGVLKGSFWVEIDTITKLNVSRVNWDQICPTWEFTFKIYESYYRWRHWGQAISYPYNRITKTNLDIIDGLFPENVPLSSVTYYNYY